MRRSMRQLAMIAALGTTAHAQPACFRSIPEAAAQSGPEDTQGFRVNSTHLDVFSGITWAAVVSCVHPERPAVLIKGAAPQAHKVAEPARAAALVLAGTEVRMQRVDASSRMEVSGVALANGAAGERVRVRLQSAIAGAQETFVTGIVRTDGTLDLED